MVICLYLCLLLTLLNHDMCYADGKAKAKIGAVVFPARAEQRQKPSGSTGEPRCPAVSMGKRGKYQPSLGKLQPQGETNPYSLVRPPEHSPASPAPGSRGGPARWCWRDGQTPAALRGGDGGREGGSQHPPLPSLAAAPKVFPPECLPDDNRIPFIYIRQTRAQGG